MNTGWEAYATITHGALVSVHIATVELALGHCWTGQPVFVLPEAKLSKNTPGDRFANYPSFVGRANSR